MYSDVIWSVNIMLAILLVSEANKLLYKINNPVNPSIPNPTTPRPITEPPANAIPNALPRESCAALVVRTFALVATFIPRKPAKPEANAPTKNEIAIIVQNQVSV